uniref:Uncharacterized protein n=1 Tax=Heterorhabditis bacteriophora TaxID=37862 RepID=A0A1I7XMP6_HETBA
MALPPAVRVEWGNQIPIRSCLLRPPLSCCSRLSASLLFTMSQNDHRYYSISTIESSTHLSSSLTNRLTLQYSLGSSIIFADRIVPASHCKTVREYMMILRLRRMFDQGHD